MLIWEIHYFSVIIYHSSAHSDNETTEPLGTTFDETRKIARRETAGADVLRRPGSSRSKRHSDGRPRSLPENIEEVLTNTAGKGDEID